MYYFEIGARLLGPKIHELIGFRPIIYFSNALCLVIFFAVVYVLKLRISINNLIFFLLIQICLGCSLSYLSYKTNNEVALNPINQSLNITLYNSFTDYLLNHVGLWSFLKVRSLELIFFSLSTLINNKMLIKKRKKTDSTLID